MRSIVILFTVLSFCFGGIAQKSVYIYGTVKGLHMNQFPVNQFNYSTQDINIIATVPVDSTGHYAARVCFDPSKRLTICWVDVFATPGDSVELNFEALGSSESIQLAAS